VREAAASLAAGAGITIEHVAKGHLRKEAIVAKVLEQRGPSGDLGDHDDWDRTSRVCCRLGIHGWNGRCVWLGGGLMVNPGAST